MRGKSIFLCAVMPQAKTAAAAHRDGPRFGAPTNMIGGADIKETKMPVCT